MDTDSIDLVDFSSNNTLLIIIRVASIILVFAISILLGILPSRMTALSSNSKLIAYVNSFSAGLFLGLGLMHLLPESLEDYNQYLKTSPNEHPFPVPFGVAITSFSLILFIERILFQAHSFLHLHADPEHHHHHDDKEEGHHVIHHHLSSEGEDVQAPLLVATDSMVLECNEEKEEEIFKKLISTKEKIAKVTIDMEFHKSVADSRSVLDKTQVHPEVSAIETAHKNVAGPYAILIALSIHGMFEGAAVGIQNVPSKAINLMIAVLLHKWAEALTLGVALFKGKLAYKIIIIQVCIFSLSAPIGIVFGWALSQASFLISAIFKAISAGTFLYIAATELVVEEFSISTNMYSKFCMYLAGIVFMGLIVNFE